MIVAMAANRAIGKDNRMPWHLPADLRHFKDTTMGCPVIMGRKTFESILATLGKPLPGRRNIVVTRHPAWAHAGAVSAASPDAALQAAVAPPIPEVPPAPRVSENQASANQPGEVCVIGGAEIYRAMLPLASRIVVTEIGHNFEGDAFFPELDPHMWRETLRQPQPASGTPPLPFDFVEYRRQ